MNAQEIHEELSRETCEHAPPRKKLFCYVCFEEALECYDAEELDESEDEDDDGDEE